MPVRSCVRSRRRPPSALVSGAAVLLASLLAAGLTCVGCATRSDIPYVRLSGDETAAAVRPASPATTTPLSIAIGGMVTPEEGLAYYRELCAYIGRKVGRPVHLVDKHSYAEVNALIESRDVDIAFVCSGPYVQGHRDFGMELLAAPVVDGTPTYRGYIIVPTKSRARSVSDLQGKAFAFTDPDSNTGKLVPTYLLARMGQTPERFFSKTVYTGAHDLSIESVAEGLVDAASVDGLIWQYSNATAPRFTSRTRIIWRSEPFGMPPVVAHPELESALKSRIREVLLGAAADPEGRSILRTMRMDRFVTIKDSAYDSVRRMQAWVERDGDRGP